MIRSQTIKMMDRARTNATTIIPRLMITKKGTTKKRAMSLVDGTSKDTNCPSELEVGALHMAQEMQMMMEKMDMMISTLEGRVSTSLDKLVHRIDSPFIALVISFPFSAKFKMP